MAVAAIIPARGGSKGIPDKNLRRLNGRSLLARSVETAQQASTCDRVIVSTDEPRLADEARRFGAEVVERPAELADDTASSEAALLHVLASVAGISVVAFLQCTSPFTRPHDVDLVVEPVLAGRADSTFSAAAFHGFIWRYDGQDHPVGVNHEASSRPRRQDRREELIETGAVYSMTTSGLRDAGHRFFGRLEAVRLDARRALEIDSHADLEVARSLAPLLDGGAAPLRLPVPRLVALDFDGVFTDNRVFVDEDGRESVRCDRGDGYGLSRLQQHIPIVVLSTEENPVVAARCRKLKLPYEHGLGETKEDALRRWTSQLEVDLADVLYVGNDVNDLGCLRSVGVPVAVSDAVPEVKYVAHAILSRPGGSGALRELADTLLAAIERKGDI